MIYLGGKMKFLYYQTSWPDLCKYLINHPSGVFTNESLKACKSLHTIILLRLNNSWSRPGSKLSWNWKRLQVLLHKLEVGTLCSWVNHIIPPSFLAKLIGKQHLLKFLQNILRKLWQHSGNFSVLIYINLI